MLSYTYACLIFQTMPDKCCVTGCRGNYRASKEHPEEKVSVFRFPADEEMRAKWIRQIPRQNLIVGPKTVVCEKHFVPEFIIRVDNVTRADGSVLSMPRTIPKLTTDAYPSIFPNTPTYLSSEPAKKRKTPEERSSALTSRDEEIFSSWIQEDQISSFTDLCENIEGQLQSFQTRRWITLRETNCLFIYTVDMENTPRITTAIKIHSDLVVDVYRGESHISSSSLQWILGAECRLTCWSQFTSLLSHFSADVTRLSVKEQLGVVECAITELIEVTCCSEEYGSDIVDRLNFLREQITLLFSAQPRYSPETLFVAFRFFAVSASIYRRLRSTVLSLPHVSYLKRLSSVFSLSGGLNENAHSVYLQQKAQMLQEHEKHVLLLLDEIYVEPRASYKGGCIVGKASNDPLNEATTVQTFMICSLLSPNKDVAAVVPVKNLTTAYLKECTEQVLNMLESAGYFVFCLISDNNRVNRNMFAELCGGSLKPFMPHPCSPERKLFFMFDSVHLLKCIRNNWLGQSDADCTFTFPDMTDGSVCKASLCHLRQLYASEKDKFVRLAPGLSYKSLYPSNIERQNVKLVLKIFDEKTIAGLNHFGSSNSSDVSGTVKFISIILRMWKILNVKSTDKGHHKRDDNLNPIRSVDDDSVKFLRDVCRWLDSWNALNLKARQGRLSDETFFALKHTVNTFLCLFEYLFNELKLTYVLTGKFQTDCLEFRFSQYRQLSGANFHVSVQEIKESEKKLKIVSILHAVSASRGLISLRDFVVQANDSFVCERAEVEADDNVNSLLSCCLECDDVEISETESQSLVFIAGYVGHKLTSTKVPCEMCRNELVCDRSLQMDFSTNAYAYLSELDRGGLKFPTDFLLEIVTQAFLTFRLVVSKDYESKFLNVNNQKACLSMLILEKLKNCGITDGECTCGISMLALAEMTLSHLCNIFLNNYCKKNDRQRCSWEAEV